MENEESRPEIDEVLDTVEEEEKMNPKISDLFDKAFGFIAEVFSPVIPALAGSGILRGILLLLAQVGVLDESNGVYVLLNIASSAIFYFLPVILAFSTAQVLKVNPYIGVLIAFTLLHPDFISLADQSAELDFLGIPTVFINYGSTVIPIIFAILLYSLIYNFLEKHTPESLKIIVLPLATLVVVVPVTVLVIGPLGYYGGEALAQFISFLIVENGTLTGVVIGALWLVIIMMGLNWAINPIMLNNLSAYGFDYIRPFTFAANFSALGIVLGIFLSSKRKEIKNFAGTNVFTIAVSGIIEPTLYGILIKDRRYFVIQIIGGALGGAYLGFSKVVSNAFVFGSLITLPALVTDQTSNLVHGLIGLLISLTTSATLSFLLTRANEKRLG